ncbi:MAG: preprotein translocase subunit YajC [Candidatus Zixiibacteriota bacterium]
MSYLFLMASQAQGTSEQGSPLLTFLPLIVLFAVFYIFILLPQQKKQKKLQKMIEELKRGDRVVTNGGIMGQVIGRREDIIVIKSGESKFEVNKNFIAEKISEEIKTNQ